MLIRALAGLLAAALLAASPAAAEVVIHRGNAGGDPNSIDPHQTQGTWENFIVGDLLLGLVTEDAEGKLIPGAAESWTTSPDGITWTFKMRQGAVWSDGTPVTADDFVYSWRRLEDPATAAQYSSILYVVKNAEAVNGGKMPKEQLGVAAPDPGTLVVTLEHPAPYFDGIAAHQATFPVPRWQIEKFGKDWIQATNYVGNGPYTLVEWRPQQYIKMIKNPRFYDAANVKIDTVYWVPVTDANSALKQFRVGELDMHDQWPVSERERLKQTMPEQTHIAPFLEMSYLTFNEKRKPFDDARVRAAISLVYDRDIITNKIYGLGEPVACSIVPPGTANYDGAPSILPDCKYASAADRIAKAKALLAEAGFGPDNPLTFSFFTSTDPDNKRMAAAAQSMWRQAGMNVDLQLNEPKIHYNQHLQTGDFDVAAAAWVGDFNDPETFLFLFESNNAGFNYGHWSNPDYDALMAQERQEADPAKRSEIMHRAEQIALDDYAVAPVRFQFTRHLVQTYVKNWHANIRDVYRTRWLSIEGPRIAPDGNEAANGAPAATQATSGEGSDRPWYWWIVAVWDWFKGLLCSWFGIACPTA